MYFSYFIFQLSPNKKDRYEPLRSISSKLSPVIGGLSGSKSFGEHLSGVGNFINKPMMAISKKLTNNKPVSIYWKVCIEVGDQSSNPLNSGLPLKFHLSALAGFATLMMNNFVQK